MEKWISVKERLPDKNEVNHSSDVLITNGEDIGFGYYLHSYKQWHQTQWTFLNDITHWMPLPKPPIETSQETQVKEIK